MFDIFAATYTDYLARKKREGKKPLSRAEWEARTQGGTKAGPHPKGNTPPKTWKKKYAPKVEAIMDQHALTDEDADQVREFKSDRPSSGVVQTPAQLMQRFLSKAKPETKERMKGVTPAEFMQMLGAIMDDEEGGQGKTATALRSRLIRLAHMRPELRSELLPLLQEDADPASHDQNKPEYYYGLPPRGVQASIGRPGDTLHAAQVFGYNLAGFPNLAQGIAKVLQKEQATELLRGFAKGFNEGAQDLEEIYGESSDLDYVRLANRTAANHVAGTGSFRDYDQAMAEAVALANRLHRPVELKRNRLFATYEVNLFSPSVDVVRGEIIRPGTPLTPAQQAFVTKTAALRRA
jgi:hypothetical protein